MTISIRWDLLQVLLSALSRRRVAAPRRGPRRRYLAHRLRERPPVRPRQPARGLARAGQVVSGLILEGTEGNIC